MNTKYLTLSIVAVILGFVGGFLLANSLNRSDINTLRAEIERLKKNPAEDPANPAEEALSVEEIRQKIAEADRNPNNFSYQRNLGLALYRYGAMKQDVDLIADATRLLQRSFGNDPEDYDVIVALGNAFYDVGYFKKDLESFKKAREFYQKALARKPDDADVRVDLGLSYYLSDPPELEKTAAELRKALEAKPNHERALQFMTRTLLKQNKREEAEKYLARLKAINPQTPSMDEIVTDLGRDENKAGQ